MDIKELIKKWENLDEKNKVLNAEQRELRNEKNNLNDKICDYMKQRKGSQITIGETKIKMYEKKEYGPLTFTYVEECLKKVIDNEANVKYIMKVLKDQRQIKITNELKKI